MLATCTGEDIFQVLVDYLNDLANSHQLMLAIHNLRKKVAIMQRFVRMCNARFRAITALWARGWARLVAGHMNICNSEDTVAV